MTLTFLTNPFSRAKLDYMNLHQSEEGKRRKQLRSDIRFYRKRIFNVVKCLVNNKDVPTEVSSSSIQAWNELARCIIEDFRVLDTHDSIQEELVDVSLNVKTRVCSAKDSDDLVERANKEMMVTKTVPITLDKFVIKKTTKQPFPWSANSIKLEIPETKVDLTKQELRTKGVKPKEKAKHKKKENVASEYEKVNEGNKKT
jgi:hypothetical protein